MTNSVGVVIDQLVRGSVEAFNLGKQEERERIIALLGEMAKTTFPGDVWHINPFDYAIALIKGENE